MRSEAKSASGGAEPQVAQRRAPVEEVKVIQLVVFTAGEEEFCADIAQVREIIRIPVITPIPDSPDFIRGIINVRGEVVCVVDLKGRFFLHPKKEEESKHIVISEQEKNLFGLLVDEVTEVLRIPATEIKATPGLVTKIEEKYVAGVVTLENRLIIQLDLSKVLSEEELVKLSEVTRHHVAAEVKAEKNVAAELALPKKEAVPVKPAKGGKKKL